MPVDLLVLGAALLTGLMGSTHCLAMCGGIATGLASHPSRQPALTKALALNFGRIGGYALAGALVGGLGGGLLALARAPGLGIALRVFSGVLMLLVAARLLWPQRFGFIARGGAPLWRWLRPLQQRIEGLPDGLRPWLLGALWGWLPCGLSTTMLAAAWLQADALAGAALMLAFGAGTLVTMVPLTWSGARILRRLAEPQWRGAAAGVIALSGVLTLATPWLLQVPALHSTLRALGCQMP